MTHKEKYVIRIETSLVEVSQEIYEVYYREKEYARYLERRDKFHGKVNYADLDTDEITGEESIPDTKSESIEDDIIRKDTVDELRKCIALLTKDERELIQSLFFEGLSERQLSDKTGIHNMTIHNRKRKILEKLRKMLEK